MRFSHTSSQFLLFTASQKRYLQNNFAFPTNHNVRNPTRVGTMGRSNQDLYHLFKRLEAAGIPLQDAETLRRISMTLRRWFELECGNSNNFVSWAIVRGRKSGKEFIHDDDGMPFLETHYH